MPAFGQSDLKAKIPAVIKNSLIAAFTVITFLGVFIPSYPRMPDSGLDPSWEFAMNEAVARHLSFGRDIIFTYGPYSSLSTRFYDPGTDNLMLLGGLVLALAYAFLLLYLARGMKRWHLAIFLLFVAGLLLSRDPLSASRDALFFSYPLLVVACVTSFLGNPPVREDKRTARPHATATTPHAAATALATAPLGLLPLIKGTYLIVCAITIAGVVAQLLSHRQFRLAVVALICPIAATLLFWKLSGQAISNMPGYFAGMSSIVSGYTEAMSMQTGHKGEIRIFLFAAVALVFSIATTRKLSPPARIPLALYISLYLFTAFKGGFVRQDVHAMIGGCSILMAAMIVWMLFMDGNLAVALILSFLAWFYIDKNHARTSTDTVFDNLRNVYLRSLSHLPFSHKRARLLHLRFDHALGDIRKEFPIPDLQGSVDIYPAEQSAILASNNTWNPRPVFQSYSAYTPALAAINERHLREDAAPDNILFSVDPIDMRLPSLEDGPSWPALLDNYTVTRFDQENDIAYLRRNSLLHSSSQFTLIEAGTHHTNESVAIPVMNVPIFVEIDFEPTFLGELLGLAFKYPKLKIELKLRNGKTRNYRVLSHMMQSGFILSPLVEDTEDFTSLMKADSEFLREKAVSSIKIVPESRNGTLWNQTYTLKLKAYHPAPAARSFP